MRQVRLDKLPTLDLLKRDETICSCAACVLWWDFDPRRRRSLYRGRRLRGWADYVGKALELRPHMVVKITERGESS
jgi:hypothetical protein